MKGASPENIVSGFAATGIYPPNRLVFKDIDFLPSSVTDRPYEEHERPVSPFLQEEDLNMQMDLDVGAIEEVTSETTSTTNTSVSEAATDTSSLDLSIEEMRPYPKAGLRKQSNRGRKRRSAAILTDPIVLEQLRKEQEEAARKKTENENRKKAAAIKKLAKELQMSVDRPISKAGESSGVKKPRGRPKKVIYESSSESDDDTLMECCECHEILKLLPTNRKCTKCPNHAHAHCAGKKNPIYVCTGCQSSGNDTNDSDEVMPTPKNRKSKK